MAMKKELVQDLQAVGAILGIAQRQLDQTRGMVGAALSRVTSLYKSGDYSDQESEEYKELLHLVQLVGGCSELFAGIDSVLTSTVIECLPSKLPDGVVDDDDDSNDIDNQEQ